MAVAVVIALSWLALSLLTAGLFAMLCRGADLYDRTRLH